MPKASPSRWQLMVSGQLYPGPLKKAAGKGQRHTYLEFENIAMRRLVQHLTFPVQHRQSLAITGPDS